MQCQMVLLLLCQAPTVVLKAKPQLAMGCPNGLPAAMVIFRHGIAKTNWALPFLLIVTPQASESGMSSGSTPSGMSFSSHSGFQSLYFSWLSLRFSSPYDGFQTRQGVNQLGSACAVTTTQQATDGATVANGSSTSDFF